jgi:hypothetical protein
MKLNLAGWALAAGSICLWLAWALMPDAATNDAAHILAAVASQRADVHRSTLLQLAGAALLVPGLVAQGAPERRTRAGAIALLWGAMGMAADAVYHQLAYQMTAPGIATDAVLPVMTRMQTDELRPLVPLLLMFLAGAVLLGLQRLRRRLGPAWIAGLLMAPVATIPLGVVAVTMLGAPRRAVVLATLGAICAGLAALGLRSDASPPPRDSPR